MELFLVRHGEATSEIEDRRRPLTERGAVAVRRMAEWAARSGVQVDQIRHSGVTRAEQTAALLAERLQPARGMIAVAGLRPDDAVVPVAEALRDETASLMLVAHLPFLGRLAGLLLGGEGAGTGIRFQTAEMVCLSSRGGTWSFNWVMSPERL
jgi:phosphohistidine phosphatase